MSEAKGNEPTIYVDKKEAAAQLMVSVRTLSYWMRKRIIPFVKIGRTVRFRRTDLETKVGVSFAARG